MDKSESQIILGSELYAAAVKVVSGHVVCNRSLVRLTRVLQEVVMDAARSPDASKLGTVPAAKAEQGRFYRSEIAGKCYCVRATDPSKEQPLVVTAADGPMMAVDQGWRIIQVSNHMMLEQLPDGTTWSDD